MCGIFCEIYNTDARVLRDCNLLQRISNRGPDKSRLLEKKTDANINLVFNAAVLWMQGPSAVQQPVDNDVGILLYNGDIFDETWTKSYSDTQILMDKLTEAAKCSEMNILKVIKMLKGPFSVIFYDIINKKIYFTRDKIGRCSLLFHKNQNSMIISSVLGRKYECIEIPASHIYSFNLRTKKISSYSWFNELSEEYDVNDWLQSLQELQCIPDEEFTFHCDKTFDLKDDTGIKEFIQRTASENKSKINVIHKLLENDIINETVNNVCKLLENSVKVRLETQPMKCQLCLLTTDVCKHSTIGILFSGGLDCTILALLADKYTPQDQSLDLINVAFKKDEASTYNVPDRITGRQSFDELKKLCPQRKWVLREINIPKKELEQCQENIIGDLVYPRQTILDESLGSALWFAARGKDDTSTSPCRVLLLGSGADELFGGYTRHRNAFKRQAWSGLNRELELDWKRISFRNLARDNRVMCDHGRQPRMPYLDDDFTTFVLQLRPWLRCYPSDELGPGIGDKLMLRLIAYRLGLSQVATFPKRALQFGSRIANKKEKGSDISQTFIK